MARLGETGGIANNPLIDGPLSPQERNKDLLKGTGSTALNETKVIGQTPPRQAIRPSVSSRIPGGTGIGGLGEGFPNPTPNTAPDTVRDTIPDLPPAQVPLTNQASSLPSDVTTSEQYNVIREQLLQNQASPELSPEATQQYTTLATGTDGALRTGESVDPNTGQIETQDQVAVSNYSAAESSLALIEQQREAELSATGFVSPGTAATYQAAQADFAQAQAATQREVSRLVTATNAEAVNAEAAYQDLNKVDPRTMVSAVTGTIPNSALVKTQLEGLLDGLETGEIPLWAQPAVAAAESLMASRGMSSSSVGRNALFNSVIDAAMPIAQADAKSQLSVFQQNLSNQQQAAMANSQFFQGLTMQNLSNKQQTALANAANQTNVNITNANNQTRASVENAKNFLTMDIANMNNEQQANMLDAQLYQQTLLSNQSASNAASQFNATSEQQNNQFTASLTNSINQFNASQQNAMNQFNVSTKVSIAQANAAAANQTSQFNASSQNQASQFSVQQENAMSQFNSQMGFNREQFNSQNALIIEQSNVNWRRQMNQIDTAGLNAVNQANAMNQFSLSNQALSWLWQEQRDNALWSNNAGENATEQQTRLAIAALSNESMSDAQTMNNIKTLAGVAISMFDTWNDKDEDKP